MPNIPTQQEPGSVPLQDSAITAEAGNLAVEAQVRQTSSIAGLLLGKASAATNQAQQNSLNELIYKQKLKEAERRQKLEEEARKLQEEKDLVSASKLLNKTLDLNLAADNILMQSQKDAARSGSKIDTKKLRGQLTEQYNKLSKDLDSRQRIQLQQQLNQISLSYTRKSDDLNIGIEAEQINQADQASTKQALKEIFRMDGKTPEYSQLESAIAKKKDFLMQMGIEGKALDLQMESVTEDFTNRYYEYLTETIKQGFVPSKAANIADIGNGKLAVEFPHLKSLTDTILKEENLTVEAKSKLVKNLRSFYDDATKEYSKQLQSAQEQVKVVGNLVNNKEIKEPEKQLANSFVNNYASQTLGLPDFNSHTLKQVAMQGGSQMVLDSLMATKTNPKKGMLDEYFTAFEGTQHLPTDIQNAVLSLTRDADPNVSALGIAMFRALESSSNKNIQNAARQSFSSSEFSELNLYADIKTYVDPAVSYQTFINEPGAYIKYGAQQAAPKDEILYKDLLGTLDIRLNAESGEESPEFVEMGNKLQSLYRLSLPPEAARKAAIRDMVSNHAVFTSFNEEVLGPNFLRQPERVVYMKGAGMQTLDRNDIYRDLNRSLEAYFPDMKGKDIVKEMGIVIQPTQIPGDNRELVANFRVNYTDKTGNLQPLVDPNNLFGESVRFTYFSPKSVTKAAAKKALEELKKLPRPPEPKYVADQLSNLAS